MTLFAWPSRGKRTLAFHLGLLFPPERFVKRRRTCCGPHGRISGDGQTSSTLPFPLRHERHADSTSYRAVFPGRTRTCTAR